MVKETKNFLSLLLALVILSANASVEVTASPEESNGDPVVLKFLATNEENIPDVLNVPNNSSDWRISPPFTQSAKSFSVNGLSMESQSTTTITFFLYPLRKGQLKLPNIQIKLGDKVYSAPEKSVRVTQTTPKKQPNQRRNSPLQAIPGFPLFPLEDELLNEAPTENESKSLDVAIIAEPSKVEVYTGELITLPFYIYTNENIFRNLEFASFPTFKDFIKEELYLPKNWRTERTKYRGENYYKAEIIRFALFPVKEGNLLIDPLNMRFEIDDSIFSLRKHFNGQTSNEESNFLRSSGSVPITVKPLPPKPAAITQSEIAVGNYTIKLIAPSVELVQNEAFTIKLRVEGRGNIKGIPEPELDIPSGIQKSKTETDYSINTMSEGYKDFDLLLVPRTSGTLVIPEKKWAYFDPDKKSYELLPIPRVELNVLPSNKKNKSIGSEKKLQNLIFSGKQHFEKENTPDVSPWLWSIPALIYLLSLVFFIQRRRLETEEELIQRQPWIPIERKIQLQHDLSSNEALGLVEAWIFKRFQVLKLEEVAFDDFTQALRKRVPTSTVAKVDKLYERFRLIESARFGTKRKTNTLNISFDEIKKLSEEIIQACSLSDQSALDKINEEDDDD
ncbi:MAG: BatD family protein [Bdellovibrionota bacterium]